MGATDSEVWVKRKSSEGLKDEIYLGKDYQEKECNSESNYIASGYPGRLQHLHSWKSLKFYWMCPWASLSNTVLSRAEGLSLHGLPSSLIHPPADPSRALAGGGSKERRKESA